MKKSRKKPTVIREILIVSLTVIIFPFYFIYRLFFKIPDSYSPFLGIFRGVVSFAIICWLTKDQGLSYERALATYLSAFMDIDLAKFVVSVLEFPIGITFFISILIIGGFHMSMELTAEERAKDNSYPNLSHVLKDFDRRLGYGTTHGFISYVKQIIK